MNTNFLIQRNAKGKKTPAEIKQVGAQLRNLGDAVLQKIVEAIVTLGGRCMDPHACANVDDCVAKYIAKCGNFHDKGSNPRYQALIRAHFGVLITHCKDCSWMDLHQALYAELSEAYALTRQKGLLFYRHNKFLFVYEPSSIIFANAQRYCAQVIPAIPDWIANKDEDNYRTTLQWLPKAKSIQNFIDKNFGNGQITLLERHQDTFVAFASMYEALYNACRANDPKADEYKGPAIQLTGNIEYATLLNNLDRVVSYWKKLHRPASVKDLKQNKIVNLGKVDWTKVDPTKLH